MSSGGAGIRLSEPLDLAPDSEVNLFSRSPQGPILSMLKWFLWRGFGLARLF
jgi:hypothetical protein